ncbi:glutamine-hydrolyzing carbamoyl-phosphate synthase small subunit [Mycoplasma sp. SG1]|uniref:glutamine-hydrolyzing carbamoyl-phosphate synthase small subunit n=1 Tax=Mycoplasma sp. SG1 TaxID=2810348 RepID=UPI00202540B7|nr:glutamine-hydrolyzing carbamoyl-phosphate synthase small subunit [Mycoplasma sp. SG1]URM52823.1 glutamine-hydrolyzing carbamoyl-phosphate synthase small subunit [Mycoplasma sp. SG1]
MPKKVKIVFENKKTFLALTNYQLDNILIGDIIFNTSVVGYQEVLTDPSYSLQILVFTFPLIGTYPIYPKNFNESKKIQPLAVIVNQIESFPVNNLKNNDQFIDFSTWTEENNIPVLFNVDTRALTKYIRDNGASKVAIAPAPTPTSKLLLLLEKTKLNNHVQKISQDKDSKFIFIDQKAPKTLVIYDIGVKNSIINYFKNFNLNLIIVPWDTKYQDLKKYHPNAYFFSNGPGDPHDLKNVIGEIKEMIKNNETVLGICLGHQLIGLALGFEVKRLPFGHHSINHPVQNLISKKVFITSQNHDYYLDLANKNKILMDKKIVFNYISLLDLSNEGIESEDGRIYSVQFHPEAAPGPEECVDIFKEFYKRI